MLENSGSYVIETAAVQCGARDTDDDVCLQYEVGTIQVSVRRDDPNPPRSDKIINLPFNIYHL